MFLCAPCPRGAGRRGVLAISHCHTESRGTIVTNGSAFLLIAPSRERLLRPSWHWVQRWYSRPVQSVAARLYIVRIKLMTGLNAWLAVFD